MELSEKFNLPAVVLDAREFRQEQNNGSPNPFERPAIVIASFHFASQHAAAIRAIDWDLSVIDEAHKLRNAYRSSNRMGANIRCALDGCRKVLLTATPLQNSLLELYGIATILDEHIFGDVSSFRSRFVNVGGDLEELKRRLNSFCKRTLRRQVTEYIQYTERRLITRPFHPTEQEHKLYEAVSAFLQRPDTYALPHQQRHLTALVVRKLLASSPLAVAATLEAMRARLIDLRDTHLSTGDLVGRLIEDEELEDDLLDEIINGDSPESGDPQPDPPSEPILDLHQLKSEIDELGRYAQWARSIGIDTKSRALLTALEIGFTKMAEMGAARRAVVFTESRRTQTYLKQFLEANGHAGRVITFNGSNSDPLSSAIFQRWLETNQPAGRASGSRQVDVRTAILEHFRDDGEILIATEAAAEGINLQFCSLVVNYDLPWNPQRVEQRIGRCHRYGQKHDVVVINFLNEKNEADRRVHELLEEKFNLFSGVFGASDDVLGAIESGIDFERKVLDIYQQCRNPEDIARAFQALRAELDETIQARLAEVRRKLLEHFDEDVHARLRVNLEGARRQLDRVGAMFWSLTCLILRNHARFDDESLSFHLEPSLSPDFTPGHYHLVSKGQENTPGLFLYRLSHPLGEFVLELGKVLATPLAHLHFNITSRPTRIAVIEALRGQSGWLHLQHLVIDSFEREEHLLFSGIDDNGKSLDQEILEKLFQCHAFSEPLPEAPSDIHGRLAAEAERHARATISRSLEQNNLHFQEARERLEKWADDMVLAAEKELKDTKERIKVLQRQARLATTTDEQHSIQEQIRDLEKLKRRHRQRIFDVEDEIMAKRDALIEKLERRMHQRSSVEPLFTIRWSVV
jgi:hypothetical protein